MRSAGLIQKLRICLPLMFIALATTVAFGQNDGGSADLDKAFDEKINARSTKDLDKVVKLCESAIEKGLDKEGEIQAKQLAATTLYEHAEQLNQRISPRRGQERDPRWRILRSQAISRLKKAVKYDPELVDAYLMMATLNTLPGGNRNNAIEAIDEAVALSENDRRQKSRALFLRSQLREGEDEKLDDLNKAIEANPNNTDAVRVRSVYYLRKRQPDKAIGDLKSWLNSDKSTVKNHVDVVRDLMRMGDKFDEQLQEEAFNIVEKAIELEPENPSPFNLRAELNMVKEDLDAAVEDTSRALKLATGREWVNDRIQALLLRASLYSELEKLDEALDDINESIEIRLTEAGLRMRGIIRSQKGDFDGAIQDIGILANRDPSNQFYQRQLAMLFNANDEPSKSVKIYDRLLRQAADKSWDGNPPLQQLTLMQRRVGALRGRGDARLSLGKHKGAIEDYEEAMKLGELIRELQAEQEMDVSPVDDGVLNNLAWVLATSPEDDLRNGERAVELATSAAEVTEFKEAHILSTLASGYAEAGDFENAIKWIEKAIEVNKEVGEKAVDKTRTDEQFESLNKEYDSYKEKKPWRELQNVEEEKAEKQKKEAEAKKKEAEDEEKKTEEKKTEEKKTEEKEESDKEADKDDPEQDDDKKSDDKGEADKN